MTWDQLYWIIVAGCVAAGTFTLVWLFEHRREPRLKKRDG
jgi:hypothetical protein